jgi:Putative zinc-finger
MKEIVQAKTCERSDDLIAFLYGELTDVESRRFQRHLQECAGCKAEYIAFGQLRESIITWRNESLGVVSAPGDVNEIAVTPAFTKRGRRSALAAIREFFDLSPLWLKGAAAFASVLFCVCAVLAVAYLKGRQPIIVQSPDNNYTKQKFDQEVARQVQSQLEQMRARDLKQKQSTDDVIAKNPTSIKATPAGNKLVKGEYAAVRDRRPLTRRERRELAADLRIFTSKEEDDLDLTGDTINQAPR